MLGARLLRQSAAFLAVCSHGNEALGGTMSATGKRFLFPLSPWVPRRAAWVPVEERWAAKLAARPAFPGRPAIFSTVSLSAGVLARVLALRLAASLICQKLGTAGQERGREDVLWCPEGHVTEPMSSKR